MCLTAHFFDNGWNLQKRILNFCQVPNHKGDTLGRAIEACLLDWGIDRILCITVDNASSNDTALTYLKKCVNGWGNAILESKHLHMRCGAHILNLIVEQGLKEYNISINRIRAVVRYVRGSPIRLQKFKSAAEMEKLSTQKLVCLDVTTRWNSTYLMLDSATYFQKAFERLEITDLGYYQEFCQGVIKQASTIMD